MHSLAWGTHICLFTGYTDSISECRLTCMLADCIYHTLDASPNYFDRISSKEVMYVVIEYILNVLNYWISSSEERKTNQEKNSLRILCPSPRPQFVNGSHLSVHAEKKGGAKTGPPLEPTEQKSGTVFQNGRRSEPFWLHFFVMWCTKKWVDYIDGWFGLAGLKTSVL